MKGIKPAYDLIDAKTGKVVVEEVARKSRPAWPTSWSRTVWLTCWSRMLN